MTEAQGASAMGEWRRSWPLVLTAFLGMSMAAISTSMTGIMMIPMERALHWSRAAISSGPLLTFPVVLIAAPPIGFVIDRVGPRLVALGSILLLCGAVAAMGQIGDSIWQWRALWVLVGLANACFPAVWVQPVTRRFSAGRGLAIALVLCGSGLTPFAVSRIAEHALQAYDWRMAYAALGAAWAAVLLPLTLLFVRAPAKALLPDTEATKVPAATLPGLTLPQGLRCLSFWKVLFAYVAVNAGSLSILLNLVPVLVSTGLSQTEAAAVYGFSGFATIGGRVAGGWLVDRLPARTIAGCASVGMVALPGLLLAAPGSYGGAMAALLLFSAMGGAMTPSVAYLVSRHIGQRSFATFYAFVHTGSALTIAVAPLLANRVYDMIGTYQPVLLAAVPLILLGALLFVSTGRYPVFKEANEGEGAV
jgi:MFS family permease